MSWVPDLPVLLAFTLAGFVLFITPGPDMSLWLARTLAGGRRLGLAAMAGTSAGCLVHAGLAAGGVSVLVAASPVAFGALKVVGALYLLWLAWGALRRGSTFAVEAGAGPQPSAGGAFLTGLLVNLSNPKVVIFFITFLPNFVSAADPAAAGKLLALGLWFVLFNAVLGTVLILMADRVVALLRASPRLLRWIDRVFAGVFVAFAVTILRTQARA